MIDSEFDGNEELSEEEAKVALKNSKKAAQTVTRKLKQNPEKKETKLKFQSEHTNNNLSNHRVSYTTATQKKNKVAVKEAMRKAQRKYKQVKNAEKSRKVAVAAKDITEKAAKRMVRIIATNKWSIIIIVLFLIVFILFSTFATSCCASLADSGTTYIASSFMSDDSDLIAANNHLNERESELNNYINHIPDYYIGWNEYNYYLDNIGHDPYQLVSYLSALNLNFKYDGEIEAMINKVYDDMYYLDVESIHEVRSETYTETDADGNETEVTITYDYFILNVRLTSKSVEEVVIQELKNEGVYDLYTAMMQTQGSKPNLF